VAYAVFLKPAALRDLRKLPEDIRRRVAVRIDALAGDPRPAGIERLQGEADLYRVRLRDYRIVYQVESKALVVLVVRVGHRRESIGGRGEKQRCGTVAMARIADTAVAASNAIASASSGTSSSRDSRRGRLKVDRAA